MEIENYEQYHQFLRRQLAYRKRTHFSERLWKVTLTGKSNNHVRLGNCYVRLGALLLKCIHGLHIILDIQFQILIGKTRLFLMKAYIIYLFWCSAFYSAFQMAPNCLQPLLFVESSFYLSVRKCLFEACRPASSLGLIENRKLHTMFIKPTNSLVFWDVSGVTFIDKIQ